MSRIFSWLVVPAFLMLTSVSQAHFPWLVKDKEGKAVLYFGENLADKTYKIPDSIASAKIFVTDAKGESREVSTQRVESAELVGLVSTESIAQVAGISTEVTFGIYNGGRLNYYCNHVDVNATPVDPQPVPKSKQARLAAKVVATNSGIDVFATWDGKPLKDVEIKLYCAEGHEEGSAKTDGEGKVSFTNKQVEDGLNGIMFGNSVEESGELDGKPYTKAAHYLTTTFFRSESQRQP